MAYKFIKYFFDEDWYEEVNEEIECESDTTDYDNDVYSVLMRVKNGIESRMNGIESRMK